MKSLIFALLASALAFSQTGYKVVAKYPVGGNGGFDYMEMDAIGRRVYLSHATQVDVIDADTGKVVGAIKDTPGVHGAAIAHEFKHGFTSNGRENKVSMFDLATLAVIKKIDVGKGPDGIYYEPKTKRIFTNNHGSHDITAIDAKTGEVVGTVKLEGDGEQAVMGKDGMIYINSEDKDEVVVFDPKSLEVKHRYPIGIAETPTGLAYDPKTNRLFIGCRKEPKMVVMDSTNGKVLANFPIGAGTDFAGFDPDAKLVFLSNGDGTLSIFHEKSADVIEDAGAVQTMRGAKTMAFDPKTKKVFLTAADYTEETGADGKVQRKMKPDSFMVLVVGK